MDKTRNKIFVGCLALLLVMVAGYALFSQNLTINGTAKAQGEFSLSMTCTPGILDEIKNYDAGYGSQSGYSNDSCSIANDTVTFHTDLAYPTARRYFTIKVKNTGTIAAATEHVDVERYADRKTNQNCQYNSSDDSLVRCYNMTSADGSYTKSKYMHLTYLGMKYLQGYEKLILEPGETLYLVLGISWPYNFTWNEFQTGEWYFKSTRHYTLDFVQETK